MPGIHLYPISRTRDSFRLGRRRVFIHFHDKAFKEEEHPRGQPGNPGEFVKKGTGTRATTKTKPRAAVETGRQRELVPAPDRDQWPAHIRSLKIPPAWVDVRINQDPKADLLAIGRDAKGRPQYVYSQRFIDSQSAKKFARIKNLSLKLPRLQAANDRYLGNKDPKVREHAECLGLIMSTGIRPGSERDTGAEQQAYGATTLKGEHFVVDDGKAYLRFVGKKGVGLSIRIEDPELAAALQKRVKQVGKEGQLFPNVTESTLRNYTKQLTGGQAKPKDFRTLLATSTAYSLVQSQSKPENKSQYKKAVMSIAKAVAEKLGNTPSVALKAYISPFVFSDWKLA